MMRQNDLTTFHFLKIRKYCNDTQQIKIARKLQEFGFKKRKKGEIYKTSKPTLTPTPTPTPTPSPRFTDTLRAATCLKGPLHMKLKSV